MTLRTITFDPAEWQVVPKKLTDSMRMEMFEVPHYDGEQSAWEGILAAAPEPPAQEPMTDVEAFKRVMKLHGDTIRRLHEGDSGEPT